MEIEEHPRRSRSRLDRSVEGDDSKRLFLYFICFISRLHSGRGFHWAEEFTEECIRDGELVKIHSSLVDKFHLGTERYILMYKE